MLSSIGQNVINVTDTIFLGRVGAAELGAIGLVGTFFLAFAMLGFAFSKGAQILIARRAGEENNSAIGYIYDNLVIFQIGFSVLVFLFLHFGGKAVLNQFVNSTEILQMCMEYLSWRKISVFWAFTAFAIVALYTGLGKTRIIILSTIFLALVNIILNYGLIFGRMGLPEMGIAGAGLASSVAELAAAIVLILSTFFNPILKRFRLYKFKRIRFDIIKRLTKISYPIALQFLIGIGGWFVFFSFVENLGETDLAAANVIRTMILFLGVPVWGMSSATQTIISNIIGQERKNEVWGTAWKIGFFTLFLTLIVSLAIIFIPRQLLGIITDNPQIIEASLHSLYLLFPILALFSLSSIIFNSISGTGAIRQAMVIETVSVITYLCYAYVIVMKLSKSLVWAWSSEFVYWGLLIVISSWYLRSRKWHDLKL